MKLAFALLLCTVIANVNGLHARITTHPPQYLYHYTSNNNAADIEVAGIIHPSPVGKHGPGLYCTAVSPSESRSLIAKNNYDGSAGGNSHKTAKAFVIDVSTLSSEFSVVNTHDPHGDIWRIIHNHNSGKGVPVARYIPIMNAGESRVVSQVLTEKDNGLFVTRTQSTTSSRKDSFGCRSEHGVCGRLTDVAGKVHTVEEGLFADTTTTTVSTMRATCSTPDNCKYSATAVVQKKVSLSPSSKAAIGAAISSAVTCTIKRTKRNLPHGNATVQSWGEECIPTAIGSGIQGFAFGLVYKTPIVGPLVPILIQVWTISDACSTNTGTNAKCAGRIEEALVVALPAILLSVSMPGGWILGSIWSGVIMASPRMDSPRISMG